MHSAQFLFSFFGWLVINAMDLDTKRNRLSYWQIVTSWRQNYEGNKRWFTVCIIIFSWKWMEMKLISGCNSRFNKISTSNIQRFRLISAKQIYEIWTLVQVSNHTFNLFCFSFSSELAYKKLNSVHVCNNKIFIHISKWNFFENFVEFHSVVI